MTTARAFTHDCILALPLVVSAEALFRGPGAATAALVAGALVLANVAYTERMVAGFVAHAASGGAPVSLGRLLFKQLSVLPASLVLMVWLGGRAVALGLGVLVVGLVLFTGVHLLHGLDIRALRLTPALSTETDR